MRSDLISEGSAFQDVNQVFTPLYASPNEFFVVVIPANPSAKTRYLVELAGIVASIVVKRLSPALLVIVVDGEVDVPAVPYAYETIGSEPSPVLEVPALSLVIVHKELVVNGVGLT